MSGIGTEPEYEHVRIDGGSWGLSRPRLNVRQSTQMTPNGHHPLRCWRIIRRRRAHNRLLLSGGSSRPATVPQEHPSSSPDFPLRSSAGHKRVNSDGATAPSALYLG